MTRHLQQHSIPYSIYKCDVKEGKATCKGWEIMENHGLYKEVYKDRLEYSSTTEYCEYWMFFYIWANGWKIKLLLQHLNFLAKIIS